MLTKEQYRNKTKFVTRRLRWGFTKVGDIYNGVEKALGLKKGEKMVKMGQHMITGHRWERLDLMLTKPEYGAQEVILEGFPDMTPQEFVNMFCQHNRCAPEELVNRIRFEYL